MVPYFSQPEIHLFGRITLHAYWALVVLAVIVGWGMTVAQCRKNGLDPTICAMVCSLPWFSPASREHFFPVVPSFVRYGAPAISRGCAYRRSPFFVEL